MKKKIIFTMILMMFILGINTCSLAVFEISDFEINASLSKNGDLHIKEKIIYNTNEEVNGITRKIITKNPRNKINSADDLELISVVVDNQEYDEVSYGSIGQSGVYEYEISNKNEHNIKVYSPFVNNQKVVEYIYKLKNVGVVYNDTAELFWNFIGDEWDCDIKNLTIEILFPYETTNNITHVFGHGSDNGIFFKTQNVVTLKVQDICAYQAIDARILFSKESLNLSNKIVNKNVLEKYINEEEGLKDNLESKKIFGNLSINSITIIFVLIIIMFFMYVYLKFDKEHKVGKFKYYRERPYNLSPELLQYFYYGKIVSNSYYISVLNLIKLGVFKLESGKNSIGKDIENIIYNENHEIELKEYQKEIEKNIVGKMKIDKNGQKSISLIKLESKLENSSGSGYRKYEKGLKAEKNGLVGKTKKVPKKIKFIPIIFFIILLALLTLITIQSGEDYEMLLPLLILPTIIMIVYPIFWISMGNLISVKIFLLFHMSCFMGGVVGLFFSLGMGQMFIVYLLIFILIIYVWKVEKFSKEESEIIEKVKGLRRYIKDFSMLKDKEDLDYMNLWEDYFILSIALKLNNKTTNYFYNYGKEQVHSNLGNSIHNMNNYNSFNYNMRNTFHSYYKTAHSSSGSRGSSYSGSSGGFSGGSSSGGGGGRRWRRKQILVKNIK